LSLIRRAKSLLIGAALLLFLSLILRWSVKAPEQQTPLDRAVVRLAAPLQSVVASGFGRISSVWSSYLALVGVQQENQTLRRQNAELRSQLASQSALALRTQRLERLLDLRSQVLADTARRSGGFRRDFAPVPGCAGAHRSQRRRGQARHAG
jgi:cell shape-determining protein MreC